MTISTETRKAGPFVGNGVTTVFPFVFKVFVKADLEVKLNITATGVISTLVLDADYTVALNADQDTNPGGTVTYTGGGTPLPATKTLTIGSIVTNTQGTDITNGGGFFPNIIENMVDRNTIEVQQLALKVANSLRAPIVDAAALSELPAAAQRALLFLAFDATGQPVASAGSGTPTSVYGATLVAATTASAALTVLGVSTFAKTLLDDVDAPTALTTLGVTAFGQTITGAATAALGRAAMGTVADAAGNGILARTAANVTTARTITGTAAEITATNGDGVAGNPTLSLPAALTFTGKTVTGGTFASVSLTSPTVTGTMAAAAATFSGTVSPAGLLDISGAGAGQVAFPAAQNPSAGANVLDDYEEGTWTPIDSSGAGLVFTVSGASYTKVGRSFSAGFQLTYPATADGTGATIGGLPFTTSSNAGSRQAFRTYTNEATCVSLLPGASATTFLCATATGSQVTNVTMSTDALIGGIVSHV